LQSTIVVALLTLAALTVRSLALGAVLERKALRSATLQSTVVVSLLTPAALTVHSLAVGAALERPPGSAFSAAGRQPPRLLSRIVALCLLYYACRLLVKGLGCSGRSLASSNSQACATLITACDCPG